MERQGPPNEDDIAARIRRKVREKRRALQRKRRTRGLWSHLGVFGLVGWSVSVPLLLGLTFGVWMDQRLDDAFSWTLLGLFIGVAAGCLNAWYWVFQEGQHDD